MDTTRKTRPFGAGKCPAYPIFGAILGLVEELGVEWEKLNAQVIQESLGVFDRVSRQRQKARFVVFISMPEKIFV